MTPRAKESEVDGVAEEDELNPTTPDTDTTEPDDPVTPDTPTTSGYASVQDVQDRMTRTMSADEQAVCAKLLDDAAVVIDAYNAEAAADKKLVVSCRMVIRALGDGGAGGYPLGATQGSMTALGYTQSWTMQSGGSSGELYLERLEKKLLGVGDRIGSYSPTQELAAPPEAWP